MYEFIQIGELKVQAKRLLGYRMTLALVIIVNIVLLLQVPMPPSRQAHALSPALRVPADETLHLLDNPTQLASVPQPGHEPLDEVSLTHIAATDAGPEGDVDMPPDQPSPPTNDIRAGDAVLVTDNPLAVHIAAATRHHLPTIPLSAWRHDAQQLVRRWRHSAQSVLSQYSTQEENAIAAPRTENGPDIQSPEGPSADLLPAITGAPDEQEPSIGQADRAEKMAGLTLHNPLENAETIRFLVNRRLYKLHSGEAHQFSPSGPWQIQFHPGGEFEDVERVVAKGVYRFVVTRQGWDLVPFKTEVN